MSSSGKRFRRIKNEVTCMNRLIIIDGNSLINRAFYGMPELTTRDGIHTNAVFGFLKMLNKLIENYDPTHISVAFDMKAPTFRHIEYKEYKAQRKGMPNELAQQMPVLKEILDAYNIHRIELEGFEADDLIGTVAKMAENEDFEVIIVTGDKDALQLVTDKTRVMITRKGISLLEEFKPEVVVEKFGVTPDQIIDFKGLCGDKSDNIPGVPGIGEKTAAKLLNQYPTVEEIIENAESLKTKSHRTKMVEHAEVAMLSKRLATIKVDIPLDFDFGMLAIEEPDMPLLGKLLRRYEFNSLLKGLDTSKTDAEKVVYETKVIDNEGELKELVDKIKETKSLSIKTFRTDDNIIDDSIVGISIAIGTDVGYYIELGNLIYQQVFLEILKPVLEDPAILKFGHGLKYDIISFLNQGIDMVGIELDTLIAAYLLKPSSSEYDISDVLFDHTGDKIKTNIELLGKGKSAKKYKDLTVEEISSYGSDYVIGVLNLKEILINDLKAEELDHLFEDIEMPLVKVLASMEYEGFNVDISVLERLDVELTTRINELTDLIYGFAGDKFNINSPKQLGVILFEKLELPVIKKTKTGYSTSQDVLDKLMKKHEIIPAIMEYRQYNKLKSTYIDGLYNVINPTTKKIHSSFNQTVTVTGRISSTEPNLQNIPVKLELGRQIRKVFIPRCDDCTLIDADYSQIELRVLAHMAQDSSMIDAFNHDMDIHTMTASQVFNIPVEDVSSQDRSKAKAVNFGIVYGISDFGLATNLNITRVEAQKYIDEYFAKYPQVKEYMDGEVKKGKEQGYVTTLLNRRRYIPELKSSNFNLRAFGERTAMNTPIQGSAADIIKIAMIKVYDELKDRNLKSKLILQVHDELIIDTFDDEVEIVKELLVRNMEDAMQLSVELKVDMSTGVNWYEAK